MATAAAEIAVERAPFVAELRGVTKKYGATLALDRLDLGFRPGELTAVLGPNGAGKTTAIKLLLGVDRPSLGTARVFGLDPQQRASRTRVGAMLQISKVPEMLKVKEHLDLFASYYPNPLAAPEAVKAAGLVGYEDRLFGSLSGGERQRVLFALALVGNPDLLYLDEPTVGLDVESRRAFWEHIRAFVGRGKTVVLTTHYLEEADALADRVVLLQRGRIVADGRPSDIKKMAAGKRVRAVTALDPAELMSLPGAKSVERDRDAMVVTTSDADSFVRALYAADPGLRDLEVSAALLEDAFLQLTAR